jgi:hypothetical protein
MQDSEVAKMTTDTSEREHEMSWLKLEAKARSKYYSIIQSVPQRKHNALPLQRSIGSCC